MEFIQIQISECLRFLQLSLFADFTMYLTIVLTILTILHSSLFTGALFQTPPDPPAEAAFCEFPYQCDIYQVVRNCYTPQDCCRLNNERWLAAEIVRVAAQADELIPKHRIPFGEYLDPYVEFWQ